jgi:hypothetical protein
MADIEINGLPAGTTGVAAKVFESQVDIATGLSEKFTGQQIADVVPIADYLPLAGGTMDALAQILFDTGGQIVNNNGDFTFANGSFTGSFIVDTTTGKLSLLSAAGQVIGIDSTSGAWMNGPLDMSITNKIIDLADPDDPQDAATMAYVDAQVAAVPVIDAPTTDETYSVGPGQDFENIDDAFAYIVSVNVVVAGVQSTNSGIRVPKITLNLVDGVHVTGNVNNALRLEGIVLRVIINGTSSANCTLGIAGGAIKFVGDYNVHMHGIKLLGNLSVQNTEFTNTNGGPTIDMSECDVTAYGPSTLFGSGNTPILMASVSVSSGAQMSFNEVIIAPIASNKLGLQVSFQGNITFQNTTITMPANTTARAVWITQISKARLLGTLTINGGAAGLVDTPAVAAVSGAALVASAYVDNSSYDDFLGAPMGVMQPDGAATYDEATPASSGVAETALQAVVEDTAPSLGGPLDLNSNAVIVTLTASATFAAEEFGILDTDSNAGPVLSNAGAEATAKGTIVMALAAITSGNPGPFAMFGEVAVTGVTAAGKYFLSTTAGEITLTAPSTSGQVVRSVGQGNGAGLLLMSPDATVIVLA